MRIRTPLVVALAAALGGCAPVQPDDAAAPEVACEPLSLSVLTDLGQDAFPGGEALSGAEATGPGIAVADLDGDGWLDALVATPVAGTLYLRNDGAGRLVPSTPLTPDGAPLPSARAVTILDADADGLTDALLATAQGDVLVRNGSAVGGSWSVSLSVLPDSEGRVTYGFSAADADLDGRPEVFAARFPADIDPTAVTSGAVRGTGSALYTFADGEASLVPDAIPEPHASAATYLGQWIDADDDGRLDLYLSNDFGAWMGANALLVNDGGLSFSARDGTGAELTGFTMGASAGDTDGDGRTDLYVTDLARQSLLARVDGSDGPGFADVALARGATVPYRPEAFASWGSTITDLDADGDNDIAVMFGSLLVDGGDLNSYPGLDTSTWDDAAAQPDALFLNAGDGTFVEVATDIGFDDPRIGRAVAVGDFDRDGRPDLLTAGIPYVTQWRTSGGCGPSITVRLPPGTSTGTRARAELPGDTFAESALWPATTFSASAPELYVPLRGQDHAHRLVLSAPDGAERSWDAVMPGAALSWGLR